MALPGWGASNACPWLAATAHTPELHHPARTQQVYRRLPQSAPHPFCHNAAGGRVKEDPFGEPLPPDHALLLLLSALPQREALQGDEDFVAAEGRGGTRVVVLRQRPALAWLHPVPQQRPPAPRRKGGGRCLCDKVGSSMQPGWRRRKGMINHTATPPAHRSLVASSAATSCSATPLKPPAANTPPSSRRVTTVLSDSGAGALASCTQGTVRGRGQCQHVGVSRWRGGGSGTAFSPRPAGTAWRLALFFFSKPGVTGTEVHLYKQAFALLARPTRGVDAIPTQGY